MPAGARVHERATYIHTREHTAHFSDGLTRSQRAAHILIKSTTICLIRNTLENGFDFLLFRERKSELIPCLLQFTWKMKW